MRCEHRRPLIADTGGLLRALATDPEGKPSWPEFEAALTRATSVIVPALVLTEVDYFLRTHRGAMRKLIAELLDPRTTYEMEPVLPADLVRAMHIDYKFKELELGLVDSAVAAIAERRRVYRVLTVDRGDFSVVRIGPRYQRSLTLIP